jgi:hypothetical protein
MKIYIQIVSGNTIELDVEEETTIYQIKEKIEESENILEINQVLLFQNEYLISGDIKSNKIQENDSLILKLLNVKHEYKYCELCVTKN